MFYVAVVDSAKMHTRVMAIRHTPEEILQCEIRGTNPRIVVVSDKVVRSAAAICRAVQAADLAGKSILLGRRT